MQKKILEQFIAKYNLGGLVEAVKWRATTTGLETNFASVDRNVVGFVSTPHIQLTNGEEFNLSDTARFLRMISVLNDEITLKVDYVNETPYAFQLADKKTKAKLILSSPKLVADPKLKVTFNYEIIFKIDQSFIQTYIKACSVLSDVEEVTVISDGAVVQMMLGYSTHGNNSNIAIDVDSLTVAAIPPLSFPAAPLKEVLSANKEMTEGTVSISTRGAMHVKCTIPSFDVQYYVFQKAKKN